MHDHSDDLEGLHFAVMERIAALGLLHFPSVPMLDSGQRSAIVALWPDDDWQAFVDLGAKAHATLIYTELATLTAETVSAIEEQLGAPARQLRSHLGESYRLMVAFVIGPVVHLAEWEAPWWEDLFHARRHLAEGASQNNTAVLSRASEADWARKIAEDPRFYGADELRYFGGGYHAAEVIVGELAASAGLSIINKPGEACAVTSILASQARDLVDEVLEKIENRALNDVADLVADLAEENPDWHHWAFRTRRQKAKRLIESRYGVHLPAVADEVARWKAPD